MRSLTVVSDTQVALTFEDERGQAVTYRFETEIVRGGIGVTNGEDAFASVYRRVPGPAFPLWPERLAAAVLAARGEPLPAIESAERMSEQFRRSLIERWEAEHGEA